MAARRRAQLTDARFYEGGPCTSGHTRRYTKSGKCVECAKFQSKVQYYVRLCYNDK